jgi:hypothetical protein
MVQYALGAYWSSAAVKLRDRDRPPRRGIVPHAAPAPVPALRPPRLHILFALHRACRCSLCLGAGRLEDPPRAAPHPGERRVLRRVTLAPERGEPAPGWQEGRAAAPPASEVARRDGGGRHMREHLMAQHLTGRGRAQSVVAPGSPPMAYACSWPAYTIDRYPQQYSSTS